MTATTATGKVPMPRLCFKPSGLSPCLLFTTILENRQRR
jgi:hypothetical protein